MNINNISFIYVSDYSTQQIKVLEPGTGGGVAGGGAVGQEAEQGGEDAVSVHHGKLLIQDR